MASEAQGSLLTPTRRLWQEHVYDAAARRGLILLPLTEVLADDALCAMACGREYLGAFVAPTKRRRPRRKRAGRAVTIERLR